MYRRLMAILTSILLVVIASACGQQTATEGTTAGGTAMDHGGMHMEATSTAGAPMDHGTTGSAPYDAQFIDSMIQHHTGAITMAEQALKESGRAEIKELAQNIIASQRQEVEQMTAWRKQWYPDVQPTGGMGMSMGDMEISSDRQIPFDQRFITAMIAHHDGAIAMARAARSKAEHPELKQLAEAIIKAQETEVTQLTNWQKQWFGE